MPIYPGEKCPICGANPNITHLCNNCGEIMCEECLEIHTKDIEVCSICGNLDLEIDKKNNPSCKNCGSVEIRITKEIYSVCPSCDSEKIITIEDKQQELLSYYKSLIKNTRNYIQLQKDFIAKIRENRGILYDLRNDYPRMSHYPELESDFIILIKLFNNSKTTIYAEVTKFFQEIQRNIHYISEITITHPSNLPYINEILKLFSREYDKVIRSIKNHISKLMEKLQPIKDKIATMQNIRVIFDRFSKAIQFRPEEKIIYGLDCKLSTGVRTENKISGKNGTILITNKKLYFFHERGLFNKKKTLLFSVDLGDLQEADIKGKIQKKVTLDFVNSMYEFKVSKEDREKLLDWLQIAINYDTTNIIDENNMKLLLKYKLTLNLFEDELENAIYQLIGFHGSNQAQTNTAPSNPNQILHAQMFRNQRLPYQTQAQSTAHTHVQHQAQNQPQYHNQFPEQDPYMTQFQAPKQQMYRNQNQAPEQNYRIPNQAPKQQIYGNQNQAPKQQTYGNQNQNQDNFGFDDLDIDSFDFDQELQSFKYGQSKEFRGDRGIGNNKNQFDTFEANKKSFAKQNNQYNQNYKNSFQQSKFTPKNNGYKKSNLFANSPNRNTDFVNNGSISKKQNKFFSKYQDKSGFKKAQQTTFSQNSNQRGFQPNFDMNGARNTQQSNLGGSFGGSFDADFGMNSMASGVGNQDHFIDKEFENPSMQYFSKRGQEESQMTQEMMQLRQERFALEQTIKMMESQFSKGQISNVEFAKSYQEMQKNHYAMGVKIENIEKFLKNNVEF